MDKLTLDKLNRQESIECKFGLETLWIHPLKLSTGDQFYIFVTNTNRLGICDDWDFEGHSNSIVEVSNGNWFLNTLPLECLLKTSVKNKTILQIVVLPLQTLDVKYDYLEDIFFNYLNTEDYLENTYLTDEELDSKAQCRFIEPRINNLIDISIEELLINFQYFFNLDTFELEIESIDNYDSNCSNSLEEPVWSNILELVLSVFNISGYEYVYNDGAYNRASGYNKEVYSGYINCYSAYSSYYTFRKLSLVEREVEIKNFNSDLTRSKQTIIKFLQAYAPMGIRNLKKLNKYIFK